MARLAFSTHGMRSESVIKGNMMLICPPWTPSQAQHWWPLDEGRAEVEAQGPVRPGVGEGNVSRRDGTRDEEVRIRRRPYQIQLANINEYPTSILVHNKNKWIIQPILNHAESALAINKCNATMCWWYFFNNSSYTNNVIIRAVARSWSLT